jgi:hypothetical protein
LIQEDIMRLVTALLLAAVPVLAQAQNELPGTDVAVERITMHPGETAAFTLEAGKDHQLLRAANPGTKNAITIRYDADATRSTVTATSRTGYDTVFSILSDRDGSGAFTPAGEVRLPGNGQAAVRVFQGSLGTINVGSFAGGPHGDHPHPIPG